MPEPRVSVVLPTHDRAGVLGRSIDSVLRQGFDDLELLVVDDGSVDDSASVVAAFADPRLRYERRDDRGGAARARNHGIRIARGALLAFQDSDDVWEPGKLKAQVDAFDRCGDAARVVTCDMLRVLRDGTELVHRSPDVERDRVLDRQGRYYQTYMLGIQSTLIPRRCLERAGGFDERLAAFEDLDLFLRLARHFDFERVARPLVRYHEGHGISSDRRAELAGRRGLLRRHARGILGERPSFLLREAFQIAVRGSLAPHMARHLRPVTADPQR